MEKLVEMIREFAEQAKVPASVAAGKIVNANFYECVGGMVIFGATFLVACIFLLSAFLLNKKADWQDSDDVYCWATLISTGIGGFLCLFLFIAMAVDGSNSISCVMEPAGHLMKKFLIK